MTYHCTKIALLAAALGAASAACGSSGETGSSSGAGGSSATATTSSSTGSSSGAGGASSSSSGGSNSDAPIVFLILMENHNWSEIQGSASAPYINDTLLKTGAHAEQYFNPKGNHPSEPNYIWLEAGDNLGVVTDLTPSFNHQATTDHLVTYLEKAGVTWKSYQEDISGTKCPIVNENDYAPKHNPMVFFDDVTDGTDVKSAHCIAHVRPYSELAADLSANKVANYNFLSPDLCHDMHDSCPPADDRIKQGDDWLAMEVPKIMASDAYKAGATILITWDEGDNGSDGPIGFIALSNKAKPGYAGMVKYTHSSTLRSVEELFGIKMLLRDAANATDLSDLFTSFP